MCAKPHPIDEDPLTTRLADAQHAPHLRKVELLEQAARLAEQFGRLDQLAEALIGLVRAHVRARAPRRVLLTFARLTRLADASPRDERFGRLVALYYSLAVKALLDLPDIPVDEIDTALDDMELRCARHSPSLRPALSMRWVAALRLGRLDEAERVYRRWQTVRNGEGAPCRDHDVMTEVRFLHRTGRDPEALALAERFGQRSASCSDTHLHAVDYAMLWHATHDHAEAAADWAARQTWPRRSSDLVRRVHLEPRADPSAAVIGALEVAHGNNVTTYDQLLRLVRIEHALDRARTHGLRELSEPLSPTEAAWLGLDDALDIDAVLEAVSGRRVEAARTLDARTGSTWWQDHFSCLLVD